jgi:hypothetical protein
MANWKKVLVSGSNIEVNQISGSGLNIFALAGTGNPLLTIDASGSVSTIAQSSVEGANPEFRIQSKPLATNSSSIVFQTADDLLNFTGSGGFGFGNSLSDNTASISLIAPQHLGTDAAVTFKTINVKDSIQHNGDTNTSINFPAAQDKITFTAGNKEVFEVRTSNFETDTERTSFIVNGATDAFLISQDGIAQPGKQGTSATFTFMVTGSTIGIGKQPLAADINSANKLIISGGNLRLEGSAISASGLPTIDSMGATDKPIHGLVAYNISSSGFAVVSGSTFLASVGDMISGSFVSASTGIYDTINTLNTNIGLNDTDITNLQNLQTGLLNGSSSFAVSESIVGTANEIEVTNPAGTVGALTIGLTDDVLISQSLTIGNPHLDEGTPYLTIIGSGSLKGPALEIKGGISGSPALSISASGGISASELTVDGDVNLGGTLSFSGLSYINNQGAVISGSNFFGSGSSPSDVTQQLTGSVGITGSLEVDGPTSIDGGLTVSTGDTTITLGDLDVSAGSLNVGGAITGSVISSSGNLFASLSEDNTLSLPPIVVYDQTTGELHITSSTFGGGGSDVLGTPSDSTYDDGLLDFNIGETTVNDAFDLINEVLAGLAPAAAPPLSQISKTSGGTFTSAKLSYGGTSTSGSIPGTASVQSDTLSGPSSTFSNLSTNDSYALTNTSVDTTGDKKLGINNTSDGAFDPISGRLNDFIFADSASFVNFGNNAFGDGDKGVIQLVLNGTVLHSASLSSSAINGGALSTTNANNSGFVLLSATQSAHFTGTGNALNTFIHRSSSWSVSAADQREGWNYVFVEHLVDASTRRQSNYIEWVNESEQSTIGTTVQNLTFEGSGRKALSGVNYFTGYTSTYRYEVTNAYKNVYPTGNALNVALNSPTNVHKIKSVRATGSLVDSQSFNTNLTSTDTTIAYPELSTAPGVLGVSGSTIQVTGSISSVTNLTNFTTGEFISVDGQVQHPIKANVTTDTKTLSSILCDARTNTDTGQIETFISESFRLPSSSYSSQASVTSANYISSRSLLDTTDGYNKNLLVIPNPGSSTGQNGRLIYPDDPGNTSGLSENFTSYTHTPAFTQPNYTGLSNDRTYFRRFVNGTSNAISEFATSIHGEGFVVQFGGTPTALSANSLNMYVAFKYPGFTGFLDLARAKSSGASLIDGDGCRMGAASLTLAVDGVTNNVSFDNAGAGFGSVVNGGDSIVVRVTYGSNFTGFIRKIDLSTNFI